MVCFSYYDRSAVHAIATAYPQSTLNSTPTCGSLSDTVSYETYIAGQEVSGIYIFFTGNLQVTSIPYLCGMNTICLGSGCIRRPLYAGHSPHRILKRELFPQPLGPVINKCIPSVTYYWAMQIKSKFVFKYRAHQKFVSFIFDPTTKYSL